MTNLALRIKEDRFKRGLSQSNYADLFGVQRQTVMLWETDGPRLTTPGVKVAVTVSANDQEFREMVLEMAGLKEETPASPEG